MITNGTAQEEKYYRIKFDNVPYALYEYGINAIEAIKTAANDYSSDPWTLGNATARLAAYKEWSYGTDRYTIGGGFNKEVKA